MYSRVRVDRVHGEINEGDTIIKEVKSRSYAGTRKHCRLSRRQKLEKRAKRAEGEEGGDKHEVKVFG